MYRGPGSVTAPGLPARTGHDELLSAGLAENFDNDGTKLARLTPAGRNIGRVLTVEGDAPSYLSEVAQTREMYRAQRTTGLARQAAARESARRKDGRPSNE